jgi:hypothetical protein
MSIWKKQESNKLKLNLELSFNLLYYCKFNLEQINLLTKKDKKNNFKNYWLQKREDKEHENKLEKIAEFVTKYIKTQTKR